jgi:hypothetical protein
MVLHTKINIKAMRKNARLYAFREYNKIPKQILGRFKKFDFNYIELNSFLKSNH